MAEAPATKKVKRERLTFPGVQIVTVNGTKFFVCNVTGELLSKRVFFPAARNGGGAFVNLPVAMRWLYDHTRDRTNLFNKHATALREAYEQPNEIPMAPPIDKLTLLGYHSWIADLGRWDAVTAEKGQSVSAYNRKPSKKVAKRKKPDKITIPAGIYFIGRNKKTLVPSESHADVVRWQRGVQQWLNKNKGDGIIAVNAGPGLVFYGPTVADDKAGDLPANVFCKKAGVDLYSTCMVVATRTAVLTNE